MTILAPEAAANAIAYAAATRVAAAWTSLGLATTVEALPPGRARGAAPGAADFAVAVIDVNMGLDPDPYPILASSQARAGGANISRDPGRRARQGARRGPRAGHRRRPA